MIKDYILLQKSLEPGEHNGVFKLTVWCEQKGKPTYEKSQHFVFCFFFQILDIVLNLSFTGTPFAG